jgi:hypothetical protein
MDRDVHTYLADLTDTAREVLGDDLVAAYGAGSVGMGDYHPGRCDIDVVLVCEEVVALERKQALVSRLRHEELPCPARGLELNTGARMPFRATYVVDERPAADGRFWYGLDRSILHQSGHRIFGPPPAEMFADLSPTGREARAFQRTVLDEIVAGP